MSTTKPLEGLTVLDFSHAMAGPFTTQYLGDMGARVIKIEMPGRGDGIRFTGVKIFGKAGQTDYYYAMNRNKESLTINLREEEGQKLVYDLVKHCDIVVQNFRPGVMEKLGLGFEELSKYREGLIYCSISAFGFDGPYKRKPANDVIMQSISGLMSMTGEVGGQPVRVGMAITDIITALYALSGILTALRVKDEHPEGQYLKLSMLDACLAFESTMIPFVTETGKPVPKAGRSHPTSVPYQAFTCSDGNLLMVGAFTQGFWRSLCKVIGMPELIEDERFAGAFDRVDHRNELVPILEAEFAKKTAAEWEKLLDEADVPNAPILDLGDTVKLEQVKVNDIMQTLESEDGKKVQVAKFPVACDGWDMGNGYKFPPVMGINTRSILKEWGIDQERVDKLMEDKVIGDEHFVKPPKKK